VRTGYFGSGIDLSAALHMTNATAPPAASTPDQIDLFAVDAAAGNCTLGLRTEAAVVIDATQASSHSLPVRINGVTYRLLLSNVPY
jgi:hypothetical protein